MIDHDNIHWLRQNHWTTVC